MRRDTLTPTMFALADPTRRKILGWLAEREATVQQLTDRLPMSQPAVSKHLKILEIKILETAGLIERRKEAQRRWCRLRAAPLRDVMAFAGGFESYWKESYDRLDELLRDEQRRARRAKQP
jgi:DNA-binding transcriptional ArsR family regulator